jgi:signal peptidase
VRVAKRVGLVLAALVIVGVAASAVDLWHAGYRGYVVRTGSMRPTYPPGDLIVDRPVRPGFKVGDVITFSHSDGPDLVSHRVVSVADGGIRTKGDANRSADAWTLRPDQVVGVVRGSLPRFGYVVVFMHQPAGVAGVMTAGLALVLLWGVFFPGEQRPAEA